MTLALLCSGQGTQHAEMFALTGTGADDLFEHATRLLGTDPRDLVRQPGADLFDNRTGQILCTLQALAASRLISSDRLIVAGYSVGELAGWGVAGAIDPAQVLDLAAARAEAMNAASSPGDGLLFLRGLTVDAAEELSHRHDCAIAIVNPGEAYVLGGPGAALDAMAAELATSGIQAKRLEVHVASHTPRLGPASMAFAGALARSGALRPAPNVRLLSGIDGTRVTDPANGLDKLARQLSTTIRWADCLEACVEAGARAFLELGPGKALAEMVRGAYPEIPARALDEFRSVEGMTAWLEKQR